MRRRENGIATEHRDAPVAAKLGAEFKCRRLLVAHLLVLYHFIKLFGVRNMVGIDNAAQRVNLVPHDVVRVAFKMSVYRVSVSPGKSFGSPPA